MTSQELQTVPDDSGIVRVYLGGVPVELPTGYVWEAVEASMPDWKKEMESSPKGRLFSLALKPVARMGLATIEWLITTGKMRAPMPDRKQAQTDVVEYGMRYLIDLILQGLSSVDWIAQYVELDSGALQITGLDAAARGTGAGAQDSGMVQSGLPDGIAANSPAQIAGPNQDSAVREMAGSGSAGHGENHVLQEVGSEVPGVVAGDAGLRVG